MRVLITGAAGFVGSHLTQHLAETISDIELHGAVLFDTPPSPLIQYHKLDLRDPQACLTLMEQIRPDALYHLAAQPFVPLSFEDPWDTMETNIRMQLNLIQACLKLNMRPRMLVITSAEIYGAVQPDKLPLNEESPLRPTSPYSVSKVTQDMLGLQYFLSHQLPIMRARPFNHFGPNQSDRFVAPAFAMQIARIEAGLQEPVIAVGNLESKRDFTDVRDIVRAYRFIMEKGAAGDVYNIASGEVYSIQDVLDTLLKFSHVEIEVRVDTELLRPVDIPVIQGDYNRLRAATGWQPQISFEQTLKDVLADCRQRVQQQGESQQT